MTIAPTLPSRRAALKPPPYYVVLTCLLALILLGSILSQVGVSGASGAGGVLNVLGLLVPVLAVAAASRKRRLRRVVITIAVLCAVGNADVFWHPVTLVRASSIVLSLSLLAITTSVMFAGVIQSRNVTFDVIAGAIATYLLVGLTWSFAYALVESLWPGSIGVSGVPGNAGQVDWTTLLYFSYVTLMTIGYGDVVPVSPLARGLVIIEGLAGVGFTTIVLAFLVAARVSSLPRRDDHSE